MKTRAAWITVASLVLVGCTTTRQVSDEGFKPPEGSYRVIVMQPDVSVGLLTAGGSVEPREDWTNQARANLLTALAEQQASRGGDIRIASTIEDAGGDPVVVAELVRLHKAVGTSIALHKYAPFPLPTKQNRFDWTLGSAAVAYGTATQNDYALFLHAQDSFSSGGRVALQMAGFLTCAVGVCIVPAGGQQSAYTSLVDLKTGQVVWFNVLASSVGDIREPEGAQKVVDKLMSTMSAPKPAKASR